MNTAELCKIAVEALEDRKAEDVKVIDIREISPIADYFIIANDIIIHIFSKEDRLFYDLERVWRDGKEIDVKEL